MNEIVSKEKNLNLLFFFFSFHVCGICACICIYVYSYMLAHTCVWTCGCGSLRLMSRIILNHLTTLFIESGSPNQTQGSPMWLVLSVSLFWESHVPCLIWHQRWATTPTGHYICPEDLNSGPHTCEASALKAAFSQAHTRHDLNYHNFVQIAHFFMSL